MTDHLPRAAPESAGLPAPKDVDYEGVIALTVDATDTQRAVFAVHEVLSVSPGLLTLLYPQWLPGYHSPAAQIALFAGLEVRAGDRKLTWRRHQVEVHAFQVEVPEGVSQLELTFQFLSPTSEVQGRVVVTPELMNLQWNAVVLYPAGHYARRIMVEASLKLPPDWSLACGLERAEQEGTVTRFKPVPLDVLVDSPVMAGRHYRRVELDELGPVRLHLFADRPASLELGPEQVDAHRALVLQADRLFQSRPFDHFDFLVALSDELGGIGVEHHRCCEVATTPDYFREWDSLAPARDVMGHEYTHAWNGKFRRGSDSWTPSFERPIRSSLMWVYEGQTQYWGNVLSARSGLWTRQQALDALARTAAIYDNRAGKRWRSMSDTTRDPVIAARSPLPWVSWQRSEDYYSEGQLVWLEVDTLLRELSDDTRSLDTFAQRFFASSERRHSTSTYDFDEVVRTLNAVVEFDWATLLTERLERLEPGAPLEGLARGGYRLVYRDSPSEFARAADRASGAKSLRFSLGATLQRNGRVQEVLWESPAFDAGLTAGSDVLAVNGRVYAADELEQAIVAAQSGGPIELLVKRGKRHQLLNVDYTGGLRFPHLEPVEGARRRLDEIYAPR
ncbi:MAG: peptidase [Myxococcaceae bacterium]|nr:peptidase [Myxococcaceae bacterium]